MPILSQMAAALRRFFAEVVKDVRAYFRRGWRIGELLSFIQLDQPVREYLLQFYLVMLLVSACLVAGSYFCQAIGSSVAGYGASAVYFCSYFVQHVTYVRFGLLILGSLFEGAFLTSSVALLTHVVESAAVISLVAVFLIFGCLGISCLDRRVHWVELCCFVSFTRVFPVLLLWLACAPDIFNVDVTSWSVELISEHWRFVVFLVFCWVYALIYSGETIVRARGGDRDYVGHAMDFVTALPGVIIHICIQMCTEVFDVVRRNLFRRNLSPID